MRRSRLQNQLYEVAELGIAHNRAAYLDHRFCILGWSIVVDSVHDYEIEPWSNKQAMSAGPPCGIYAWK